MKDDIVKAHTMTLTTEPTMSCWRCSCGWLIQVLAAQYVNFSSNQQAEFSLHLHHGALMAVAHERDFLAQLRTDKIPLITL